MISQTYHVRSLLSWHRVKTVSSRHNGVLIHQGSTTHHLETSPKPGPAQDHSPWPGSLPGFGPSNYPVILRGHPTSIFRWWRCRCWSRCWSRGRSGGCCRGWTGLEWLAGICTTQCEIKTLKSTRTPDSLEEISENLGVDPLLQDNPQDGAALAGKDKLTSASLAKRSAALFSLAPGTKPKPGVHSGWSIFPKKLFQ